LQFFPRLFGSLRLSILFVALAADLQLFVDDPVGHPLFLGPFILLLHHIHWIHGFVALSLSFSPQSTKQKQKSKKRRSHRHPRSALPFLEKTGVFLYPIGGIGLLLLIGALFNFNASLFVMRLYFA